MVEILVDFWGGCLQMMTPYHLLIILLGSLVGTVVGALPGLGPSAGLALMIPMTFTMNPTAGLALLMGVYMGTMFGGRITSILINTPGDAPAIVTCMEGYPLMVQGRGGFALGVSAISSFLGGFFGIAVLIFMAPTIASLVISFGAPEYFMLLTLGLCTIALLAGDSVVKALFMTVIGFIIGLVGVDFVSGYTRFCYFPELLEGIDFVVVIMGMYGIGEVLHNVEHNVHLDLGKPNFKMSEYFPTAKELKEVSLPMLRGSLIGTVIGILPAAGGTIATFLAYASEKKLAKDPDRFGKGAPEGLAAPEAANNAVCGGAIVPVLSLGIPGDGTTAVLLGVFMIYGIVPGPNLLTQRMDVLAPMYLALFISAAILLPLSLYIFGPYYLKIVRINRLVLYSAIGLIAILGVYAATSSVFQMGLALFVAVLMYFLKRQGYPPVPFILGVILGPLAEQYMRTTITLGEGNYSIFFTEPDSLFFLVLTVVFAILLPKLNKKSEDAEAAEGEKAAAKK